MPKLRYLLLCLLCAIGLTGCGDYPTPFKGNPGATAERLSQPTAPLLAIVTPDSTALPPDARLALADKLATALQEQEVPAMAKRSGSKEWRLISALEPRDGSIVPVFTVKDPSGADLGNVEGTAASPDVWAVSSPEWLHTVATEAAPRIAALLTSIRITRDKANPDSLLNRPPKVMMADVTGAPGDGNQRLTQQIRQHLSEYGLLVQTTKGGADFLVKGEVAVTPTPNNHERVEIVWTVNVPSGDERGKVVQLNEIPAGTLDHYWGDVAVAVATEAAGGLNDVIMRQTGRDEAAKVDTAKPVDAVAPAAAAVPEDALPEPPPPPPAKPPPKKKPAASH